MDLRKKKTLRAIEEAFYELRKQTRLEAITVTELCRIAQISKATFYLHYQDIFDLSEKLQNQIIAAIVAKLDDPMEIMTNPARFMRTFVAAVESEVEKIGIIFSGNQAGILPVSIVAQLKQSIYTQSPQLKDDPKVDVFLTYHILGSYYACMEKRDRLNYKQVLKILEEIQPSPLAFD